MIRRDYIMKLVQQLFDSLFRLLNDKDLGDTERLKRFEEFYSDYLGENRQFYYANDIETILIFLQKYGDELLHRLEMLSEIMYQDVMMDQTNNDENILLSKVLSLFSYLDENGDTYSLVRQGKIDTIKKRLLAFDV